MHISQNKQTELTKIDTTRSLGDLPSTPPPGRSFLWFVSIVGGGGGCCIWLSPSQHHITSNRIAVQRSAFHLIASQWVGPLRLERFIERLPVLATDNRTRKSCDFVTNHRRCVSRTFTFATKQSPKQATSQPHPQPIKHSSTMEDSHGDNHNHTDSNSNNSSRNSRNTGNPAGSGESGGKVKMTLPSTKKRKRTNHSNPIRASANILSGSSSSSSDEEDDVLPSPTKMTSGLTSPTSKSELETPKAIGGVDTVSDSGSVTNSKSQQTHEQPQQQTQQGQQEQQVKGWRVKLYRLNADGSWEDCGTGRIVCQYKKSPKQPNESPQDQLYRELGEPTLCMHAEKEGEQQQQQQQPVDSSSNEGSSKVLLRTRILLRDAYQRQGDNIITWCEPYYGDMPSRSNERQPQGVSTNIMIVAICSFRYLIFFNDRTMTV